MQERYELEVKLRDYPDVLTLKELRLMLDGICESTALSLLHQNKIKHFRIGNHYRIPKVCVIDFMMSDEYEAFKKKVDCARLKKIDDKEERGKQKILLLCEKPQTRKDLMFLLDVKSKKTFFETPAGIWRASNDPPRTTKYFNTTVHTNLPTKKVERIQPSEFCRLFFIRMGGFFI